MATYGYTAMDYSVYGKTQHCDNPLACEACRRQWSSDLAEARREMRAVSGGLSDAGVSAALGGASALFTPQWYSDSGLTKKCNPPALSPHVERWWHVLCGKTSWARYRWSKRLRGRIYANEGPGDRTLASKYQGEVMPLFEVAMVEEPEKKGSGPEKLVHFERVFAKDAQTAVVKVASGEAYAKLSPKPDVDRVKAQVRPFV